MMWSKLKSLVEAQFSEALQGRVSIYSTAYGGCSCGKAWITLDKERIALFCTRAFGRRARGQYQYKNNRWVTDAPVPARIGDAQNARYGLVEYGELSRQSAYQSCWELVHDLSIDQAIASDDVLVQSLAMLDRRLGKRRLATLDVSSLPSLAKKLYAVRVSAEGMVL